MVNAQRLLKAAAIAALALAATPAGAQAQERAVRPGQKVIVTWIDGDVTVGKVAGLTSDVLLVGEEADQTKVPVAEVKSIQVVDSVKNGALAGAVSLGVLGVVSGVVISDLFGDLGATDVDPVKNVLAGLLWGTAIGAGIGAVFDWMMLDTVYTAGDKSVSFTVRPLVANEGKGIRVALRW